MVNSELVGSGQWSGFNEPINLYTYQPINQKELKAAEPLEQNAMKKRKKNLKN
jgi:hypothetical protein